MIPFFCFSQCDLEIINSGVGGNTTFELISRVQKDVVSQNPDWVVVMIGTNEMVNTSKMISYDAFGKNIEELIKIFHINKIGVLFVSPPPVDSVYLFERHDKNKFFDPPNFKLQTINAILKEKSEKYNTSFVDIFKYYVELGVPNHDKDKCIRNRNNSGSRDGVHPTGLGYRIIAREVFHSLQNGNKIKNGLKIICFGDSITYGINVKGEGSTKGETYPGQLKQMICEYLNQY
nr:SGNH/GDSL hydrolase family protein [Membranihabitans maritimus]